MVYGDAIYDKENPAQRSFRWEEAAQRAAVPPCS
jgi:hypothetical protein